MASPSETSRSAALSAIALGLAAMEQHSPRPSAGSSPSHLIESKEVDVNAETVLIESKEVDDETVLIECKSKDESDDAAVCDDAAPPRSPHAAEGGCGMPADEAANSVEAGSAPPPANVGATWEGAGAHPSHYAPPEAPDIYAVRWIEFSGASRPVFLQDANGPCPLLALANIVSLLGHVPVAPGADYVETGALLGALAEYALSRDTAWAATPEERASLELQTGETLAALPDLVRGLDVNPRFTGAGAFELTAGTAVFDVLTVRLVHAWVFDPVAEGPRTREALSAVSFNSACDLIAEEVKTSRSDGAFEGGAGGSGSGGAAVDAAAALRSARARLVRDWLERTAAQVTPHGIACLDGHLRVGELAVLYRNLHFSVVYKLRPGALATLVTDAGLATTEAVWETLSRSGAAQGNSAFLDAKFVALRALGGGQPRHQPQQRGQPAQQPQRGAPASESDSARELAFAVQASIADAATSSRVNDDDEDARQLALALEESLASSSSGGGGVGVGGGGVDSSSGSISGSSAAAHGAAAASAPGATTSLVLPSDWNDLSVEERGFIMQALRESSDTRQRGADAPNLAPAAVAPRQQPPPPPPIRATTASAPRAPSLAPTSATSTPVVAGRHDRYGNAAANLRELHAERASRAPPPPVAGGGGARRAAAPPVPIQQRKATPPPKEGCAIA